MISFILLRLLACVQRSYLTAGLAGSVVDLDLCQSTVHENLICFI